jgi:hypothetical protein
MRERQRFHSDIGDPVCCRPFVDVDSHLVIVIQKNATLQLNLCARTGSIPKNLGDKRHIDDVNLNEFTLNRKPPDLILGATLMICYRHGV